MVSVDLATRTDITNLPVERYETLFKVVEKVSSSTMGLTVGCARCHTHKFDPIPQRDYYRLQAVFAGVDRADRPYDLPRATARAPLEARIKELADRGGALRKRMALPVDGAALDVTDEADYIAAVEAARAGLGTPAEVERIADLGRRFAGLPGGDRLRCEAALRARRLDVARPVCGRFVTTAPPASLAQIRAAYVRAFGP